MMAGSAVLLGYLSQRGFTRATAAGRRMMENNLIVEDSPLKSEIAQLQSDDTHKGIECTMKKAKRCQIIWLVFAALALGCFGAGVVAAAFAVPLT
jgi:hypothetical protein